MSSIELQSLGKIVSKIGLRVLGNRLETNLILVRGQGEERLRFGGGGVIVLPIMIPLLVKLG